MRNVTVVPQQTQQLITENNWHYCKVINPVLNQCCIDDFDLYLKIAGLLRWAGL